MQENFDILKARVYFPGRTGTPNGLRLYLDRITKKSFAEDWVIQKVNIVLLHAKA